MKQKELLSWILMIGMALFLVVISQLIKNYIQAHYNLVNEPENTKTFLSIQHLENKRFFFNLITIKTNISKYLVTIFLGKILLLIAMRVFLIKNMVNRFLFLILFSGGLGNWLNRIWNDHAVIDYWVINVAQQMVVVNLEDLTIFLAIVGLIINNLFFLFKKR